MKNLIWAIIFTIALILIFGLLAQKGYLRNQEYNDHMMIDVYGHENGQDIKK